MFRETFKLKITWIERVFNAQNAGSVAVVELLEDVLLGHIGAAVLDPNTSPHVIKLLAVKLKELDQQHAQVVVTASRIDSRVQLANSNEQILIICNKQKNKQKCDQVFT